MSLKAKLNRFKKDIIKADVSEETNQVNHQKNAPNDLNIPFVEKWKSIGAEPYFFDDSYCLVRKVEYPLDYQHGLYNFKELVDIVAKWDSTLIEHPLSSKGLKTEQLFFFDTETTGLGGGAGNTIFLLGQAQIEGDKIVVTQHFLPNPGSEIPLYQSFLSNVDYTTLVTYNGKSFDWPQVKTRHTLIRDSLPKLPEFGHFDLYHASRRLWKSQLQQVKLANVEKEILDIHRDGDIPGYLAPMIYFDFLNTQDPEGMIGVLQHNEIDVLSLITLYIHLSKRIIEANVRDHVSEQYEVARWMNTLGEVNFAEEIYKKVAVNENEDTVKAKLALAYIYKKQKEYDPALQLFEEVYNCDNNPDFHNVCIELAKIHEHYKRDFNQALFFTKEAEQHLITQKHLPSEQFNKIYGEIEKRINRLLKKI